MTIDEFLEELKEYTKSYHAKWQLIPCYPEMKLRCKNEVYQCPISFVYNCKFPELPKLNVAYFDLAAASIDLSIVSMRKIVNAADARDTYDKDLRDKLLRAANYV